MTDTYRLADRYTADHGTVFMTGIQALARFPIEQLRVDRADGLNTAAFASGYPGSPLGGLDGAFTASVREVPDLPIEHRLAVNEEYAATSVMGSQMAATRADALYDGVIGLWYGKAPGIDRASDAIRHAVFAGTARYGGAVAIVGDDPNAKSSSVPSSSAGSLADMHIPVLYPGNPAEALDLGRHAIALSRATGLWTGLKIVADVADGSSNIDLDPRRVEPVFPLLDGEPYEHKPDGRLVPPHVVDLEREIYEVRYGLVLDYAALNGLNRVTIDPPDAWIGIVASGITYGEVIEALHRLGLETDADIASAGIRILKLQMPIPFNASTVRSFARGVDEIVILEEKHPNVETLVKDALYNQSHHPLVVGKFDEDGRQLTAGHGSLTADSLMEALHSRLARRIGDRIRAPKPQRRPVPLSVARTPFFCSGCPHNRSTVVEEGTVVGAGIGCHTMVLVIDDERYGDVVGITCMGNEGLQWVGMSPFVETDHLVQNLGDGTYFHSGQLAITAAVSAGVNITYKLLWNGTVAMTGGQDPSGRIPLASVAANLLSQGVARILITSDDPDRTLTEGIPHGIEVWHRDRLTDAHRELAKVPGVTVLIHDQGCAAEKRRNRKRGRITAPPTRLVINERVCDGCGDCARLSNCLSVQPIETPFGRKTVIDQDTCNLDYSCAGGDCPAFATITKRPPRWWRRGDQDPSIRPMIVAPPDDIPDPPTALDHDVSVHITGVGGTGVVTVSQIMGTAAMLEGAEVSGLDQIGLSQKAGPVVSDVRITHDVPPDSSRLGEGQADLLLAFDLMVASSWAGLAAANPDRTSVVGSVDLAPPGKKVAHPEIEMPSADELLARIAAATVPERRYWADAANLARALVGDTVAANIFVVGMAVQSGLLPLLPSSVEEAIRLNGVAIDRNCSAFRWGRAWVTDPDAVEAAASDRLPQPSEPRSARPALQSQIEELAPAGSDLNIVLNRFAAELTDFQDEGLARTFLADLAPVRAAELSVDPTSELLTRAAASGLYKLLAYKDEYEVARLLLLPEANAAISAVAGRRDVVAWKLHPPILRTVGRRKKIDFSARLWRPALRTLKASRRLRGTIFDPFGRAKVRRVERELAGEYLESLHRIIANLDRDGFETAIAVAKTPELVRGYEDIKLTNVAIFRDRLAELTKS